jgi:ERCC4-related helicase
LFPRSSIQPREYQQKIAEVASEANTLVVLPTGLGKTIIAIMVAKNRLERMGKGKVVVLAPTKPLALQHFKSFKESLGLAEDEATLLTGENDPVERSYLWRKTKFVFATPQTVRNDTRQGRVELNDVILMVFDEAHRCVKDYSYTQLAKLYKEQAWTPLILGLTASPGGSREKVNEIMRNLFIERVEARNEEDEDVKPYVEETRLEGIRVTLPDDYERVLAPLRELYNEKTSRLVEAGFLPKGRISKKILLQARGTMVNRLKTVGPSGKGYIFGSLINQAQVVMILHAIELAETQGIPVLVKYLTRMREKPEQGKSAASLLRDKRWLAAEEGASKLLGMEHPKLGKLAQIIGEQLGTKPTSKIIVFTQYRDTIETITARLSAEGVTSMRFVGQSNKVENEGMDQKKQSEVLDRFRDGEFSVLVSSSIGEEGLHVPDVDMVVFYEAVPSEIRSIQRRGRTGRTMPGRVIILLAEATIDEAYYFSSIHRERFMRSLVSSGIEKKLVRRKRATTLLDFMEEPQPP